MVKKRSRSRIKVKSGGKYFEEESLIDCSFIHTGSTLLDLVLGGGWARGRVANIVGDKSSGKTLLAIEACANFNISEPEGNIFYMESEAAFDKMFAKSLGMPIDKINFIEDCLTVEDFFKAVTAAAELCADSKKKGLFVLDSLDALSDKAEMDRGIDEGSFGASKAKKLSEMFRRVTRTLQKVDMSVIVISQVRDNIGVTFGRKTKRSGGKALDFYASQVLYLSEKKKINKTVKGIIRATGIEVRAKVDKNKVGMPFRECDFTITFGYGIDSVASGLQFLASSGELSKVNRKLNKKNVARFLSSTIKLSNKEYAKLQQRVDNVCRKAWVKIEEGFKPSRSKYHGNE